MQQLHHAVHSSSYSRCLGFVVTTCVFNHCYICHQLCQLHFGSWIDGLDTADDGLCLFFLCSFFQNSNVECASVARTEHSTFSDRPYWVSVAASLEVSAKAFAGCHWHVIFITTIYLQHLLHQYLFSAGLFLMRVTQVFCLLYVSAGLNLGQLHVLHLLCIEHVCLRNLV